MAFRVQKTENTGIIYADPADPNLTVRVKHTSQPKTLNGMSVVNQVTEVIANDLYTSKDECSTACVNDAISVRVRISGSISNAARKKAILASVSSALATWVDEDILSGFNPVTVPPAVADVAP